MMTLTSFTALSDADLLTQVTRLATHERRATAQLVASLAELDARRLYLGLGCSSMFTYCTQMLHLSEHAAYNRIEAARIARRFPVVLDRLADGAITLTTVCLLAAHLTSENHREVLDAARHKSKREVELLVARRAFANARRAKAGPCLGLAGKELARSSVRRGPRSAVRDGQHRVIA